MASGCGAARTCQSHSTTAVRYVELNPVAARLVDRAEDWRWSSARSHGAGRRVRGDPLTDVAALARHVPNWRAMLRHGLEAGGVGAEGDALAEAIEARLRTGRPLGAETWIIEQEAALTWPLRPGRPGRKPKQRPASGK